MNNRLFSVTYKPYYSIMEQLFEREELELIVKATRQILGQEDNELPPDLDLSSESVALSIQLFSATEVVVHRPPALLVLCMRDIETIERALKAEKLGDKSIKFMPETEGGY